MSAAPLRLLWCQWGWQRGAGPQRGMMAPSFSPPCRRRRRRCRSTSSSPLPLPPIRQQQPLPPPTPSIETISMAARSGGGEGEWCCADEGRTDGRGRREGSLSAGMSGLGWRQRKKQAAPHTTPHTHTTAFICPAGGSWEASSSSLFSSQAHFEADTEEKEGLLRVVFFPPRQLELTECGSCC